VIKFRWNRLFSLEECS